MAKLRDDIRKYEAEKETKVKGPSRMRCLSCPVSYLACPKAKSMIK